MHDAKAKMSELAHGRSDSGH
ncbi:MAG: hypothetical protein JWL63_3375, partial [Rhodocyclales bacterium]|nr:hypothetical protein [Rhodocyclales bacterium]MDB5799475.1 hypothetical protein [Rhodocyclales bacterium]MDB5800943.1 hypothetical protein [Rhodocyclales bacterium]MDB5801625.1 hypothetical protein [Rhodocyclales bacterium]MDB5801959.1 hypothetical protein [Rhodocyclales bacterium]